MTKKLGRHGELMFLDRDHVCSYATSGPILFCYGRHRPDKRSVAYYRRCISTAASRFPEKMVLITYVGDRSTPSAETREDLVRLFRDMWSSLRAAVFVIESKGFGAASQRAMATAFILGSGNRDRILATSTLHEALHWVRGKLPTKFTGAELIRLERAIRHFVAQEDATPDSV